MAFEPGGMAEKLGNRYEGRWVAKQLLRLLNEEILSVTIELLGPEEEGVDLLVVKKDGVPQLHQCKARLGNQNSWSVKALANRGILQNLRNQLSIDPLKKFVLVSNIPAQTLADICDSARNSNENPQDFYKYQIQSIGKQRHDIFRQFCSLLELNPDRLKDLNTAFNYLQRTYIELFPDDRNTWIDLLTLAGFLLTGEPETAVDALLAYAENNDKYRKPIRADELRIDLAKNHNINPRELIHDNRIAPAIEELGLQFSESIQSGLIQDKIIPRKETQQIIKLIESGQDVVLHGSAGYGKSGILFEVSDLLSKSNIPFLAIRLDRRIPEKTAKQFGVNMGLPESPVYSLIGLSAGRKAVLILDQLDAIRWTSAHSSEAMDVCKELVRQIKSMKKQGNDIVMVFACRTFDLEHDPEIKGLLADKKDLRIARIAVKELSEEQLKTILGNNFGVLSGAQKRILSCPYNLSIWMKLQKNGTKPTFNSATDLMRCFWRGRRQAIQQKTGINSADIDTFLQPILDYVENMGEISIPISLAAGNPHIRDAFISYGIFQLSASRMSFYHQCYLDHLIAEQVLNQIYRNAGAVLSWLGSKEKQSLVRREQLRQVLEMLSEEAPSDFLIHAIAILESTEVRFHLKHLVLEVIGLLKKIDENIGMYCHGLVNDSFWEDHIVETVFRGHAQWVLYLLTSGILPRWLSSQEELKINRALGTLNSVANFIPDQVTKALLPYLDRGDEWPVRILNSICWSEVDDSEQMFEMRLQLARNGHVKSFVDWKRLCAKYPLRAVRLIEAVVSTWDRDREETKNRPKGRLEEWTDENTQTLKIVAKQFPAQTWDLLVRHIERLTTFTTKRAYEPRLEKWYESRFDNKGEGIARGAVIMAIAAGQTMASTQPDELFKRVHALAKSTSPIIREIIISAYTHLSKTHADNGIRWFIEDPLRFRVGSGYREPEWMPASRLVKALSPHCSDEVFRNLEKKIINYHSPNEKHNAEYYLKGWKSGHFGYYWGKAQYFILPELDKNRISKTTFDLIRVLNRKFASYSKERFKRVVVTGGWVGSKLDPNIDKISDKAWLKIVNSDKVGANTQWKGIQVSPDHILETSVNLFAQSLSKAAKENPERFSQLALRFPKTVDPRFVSAIIGSCSEKQPNSKISENKKGTWKPARVDTIEAMLAKFESIDERDFAINFCRLIDARADENWSDQVINRLIQYAINHPDLPNGRLNLQCDQSSDEASIKTLFQNTINCVRGVAASAIGNLIWAENSRLKKLMPSIRALIQDPHPVVRMAAIEAIEPLLNLDRDLAVQLFYQACKDDLRVAASPKALPFFNYIIPSHIEQVAPLIQKMTASPVGEVAVEGACQVTARWLFHDFFKDELNECQQGNIFQRKGVAIAAAYFFHDKKYAIRCREILRPLINDNDKEVRDVLRNVFRKSQLHTNDPNYHDFIQGYLKSKTFTDNPDNFVHLFSDYPGKLIPLAEPIFTACKEFATTFKMKSRDIRLRYTYTTQEMLPILLRLYEQAMGDRNRKIADRCLDIWDVFFENRVGIAIDLTKSIQS